MQNAARLSILSLKMLPGCPYYRSKCCHAVHAIAARLSILSLPGCPYYRCQAVHTIAARLSILSMPGCPYYRLLHSFISVFRKDEMPAAHNVRVTSLSVVTCVYQIYCIPCKIVFLAFILGVLHLTHSSGCQFTQLLPEVI